MAQKKYVSLNRLSNFLDKIKEKYSQIGHKHTVSDLSDYTVDSALSSDSINPVQNKVIDAEFEAVAAAMNALERAVDAASIESSNKDAVVLAEAQKCIEAAKTDASNKDAVVLYEAQQSARNYADAVAAGKADLSHNHNDTYYTKSEIDNMELITVAEIDAICGSTLSKI